MLYTNECRTQLERRHIITFVDDSVIVSLLNNEDLDHGSVLADFIDWCNCPFWISMYLKLKMIVDFRKPSLLWILMIMLSRLYINLNTLVL